MMLAGSDMASMTKQKLCSFAIVIIKVYTLLVVCLFVCLSVSLLATAPKNYWSMKILPHVYLWTRKNF